MVVVAEDVVVVSEVELTVDVVVSVQISHDLSHLPAKEQVVQNKFVHMFGVGTKSSEQYSSLSGM